MTTFLWAALAAVALLWPAALAGPLDGIPLDTGLDAVLLGMVAAALIALEPRVLRRVLVRAIIVSLILWKAATGAVLAPDGWCVRFRSPIPIYRDGLQVPHSWDVRADWRVEGPRCSAVMTQGYPVIERFPLWFYNLPPEDPGSNIALEFRPPHVTLQLHVDGFLHADEPGLFQVSMLEDVHAIVRVDGIEVADPAAGVMVSPGTHQIGIAGTLVKDHWSLEPRWNGANVWSAATATMAEPTAIDRWMRPWGRYVTPLLVFGLLAAAFSSVVKRAGGVVAVAGAAGLSAVLAACALTGREAVVRMAPLLLIPVAGMRLPRRLQNLFGAGLLIGLPFLVLVLVKAREQVGVVTWYSPGDDWWMFQRFAYRIYMQGYWLQGGESTFWFQPLYRWIAGALHLVFGDSSVGELYWDAGAAVVGALFAFHVTRAFAGFRWGLVAAILTLTTFTIGPAWYLFGRGLSEFSSAGFLYAAALFALRARHGHWPAALAAGLLATLAFLTRLNNLPMAVAVAVFALPLRVPAADAMRPGIWLPRVSRPAALGVLGATALGLWLFTARTYYYTGVPSMLHGTSAMLNSIWQDFDGAADLAGRLTSSLMLLLTMNDPPRFDVRAVPVMAGFAAALLGIARVGVFARLPLTLVLFAIAGVAGAFVARGTAYPGRFSVHLIPVTVALTICALSLVFGRLEKPRSSRPAPQSPGTT